MFKNVGVFNSSVNIFTDLLFALIPIPMVWRLQVDPQTRIGLAVILSLGLFAGAVLGRASYGVDAGRSRQQSATRGSEESSLGREQDKPISPSGPLSPTPLSPRSHGLGRSLTILKTTEVRVSKSYETR